MDDILLVPKIEGVFLEMYGQLHQSLTKARLVIAPESEKAPIFPVFRM